jgi:hypothetical protein
MEILEKMLKDDPKDFGLKGLEKKDFMKKIVVLE